MTGALAWLGSLGGFTVFIAAVVAFIRSIGTQVRAIEDNGRLLRELSKQAAELDAKVDSLLDRVARLETKT